MILQAVSVRTMAVRTMAVRAVSVRVVFPDPTPLWIMFACGVSISHNAVFSFCYSKSCCLQSYSTQYD